MVVLVSPNTSCTCLPSSCRNTLDWGPMAPEDSMATVCFVCFVFFVCSKTNKTNKTKKVLAGTSAPHDSHRIPPLHSHRKPLEQVHGGVGVTQYQLHMPPQLLQKCPGLRANGTWRLYGHRSEKVSWSQVRIFCSLPLFWQSSHTTSTTCCLPPIGHCKIVQACSIPH